MEQLVSRWHKELELFSGIRPMIILEGNVLDRFRYPVPGSVGEDNLVALNRYLEGFFTDLGYQQVVFYSNLVGYCSPGRPAAVSAFSAMTGTELKNGCIPCEFKGNKADSAPNVAMRAMTQNKTSVVIVMEAVSRYVTNPERIDQQETNSFNILMQAASGAATVKTPQGPLQNQLVLLVNKLNDLPTWFYLDNPMCKTITLEVPDRDERKRFISSAKTWPTFFAPEVYRTDHVYYDEHPDELERLWDKFVGLTEGLTYTDLDAMRSLCKREEVRMRDLAAVVDLYKYGVKTNPWTNLSMESLRHAKDDFRKRVKGQDPALERTLDVVKRAVTGMNGLSSSSTGKPKGVLFYAGPTGTGKTETAKALAEKLFGDESACVRFDMSEYSQPHSDQKLMGAPPGYVGYEAGGQLTNAVKKTPFCILLFDEIEKADPGIMDKFLQILEDGRLTDGQGNTVYFSETIIIFTSNLGMYTKDAFGARHANVTMDMPYEEVRDRMRSAIEDHFKLELGRPEILNRIGENIVVFDFIRREAGEAIFSSQVSKIIRRMEESRKLRISIAADAMVTLREAALADLSNGGRGIGNQVESLLITPLSRWLFDHEVLEDADVIIEMFDCKANPPCVRCRVEGKKDE